MFPLRQFARSQIVFQCVEKSLFQSSSKIDFDGLIIFRSAFAALFQQRKAEENVHRGKYFAGIIEEKHAVFAACGTIFY